MSGTKESFQVTLKIDPDRANLAGITNWTWPTPPPAP